jgi:tRNA pseudouridine32 synthase/23S rRNA pseudouridine746 synthase
MKRPPPPRDGVVASHLQLPPGPWSTVLEALCARFPAIARDTWHGRMVRGLVLDGAGRALDPAASHRAGADIHYYREVADEPCIPHAIELLHVDADLVVVDKPHFLPVMPAGGFVAQTVLARLVRELDNPQLAPLHRLDRATAGVVLFSARPQSRGRYQALFRERRIDKRYEALAPPLPQARFPLLRRSRLVAGEPFFRMREAEGAANSETRIEVLERGPWHWRYALQPLTGRKHQLRVHMAALGAPILGDRCYPELRGMAADDPARPLKLLARSLEFVDPVSGATRRFASTRAL